MQDPGDRRRHRRVGVLDPQPVYAAGLRAVLDRTPDHRVQWTSGSADEATLLAAVNPVDVVLVDVGTGGPEGIRGVRRLLVHHPALAILALGGVADPLLARMAMSCGARDFVAKTASTSDLLAALHRFRAAAPRPARPERDGRPALALTAREIEVLQEIRRGRTNREIALHLGISTTTINKHVQRLLKKLNARNRAHATELMRSAAAPLSMVT